MTGKRLMFYAATVALLSAVTAASAQQVSTSDKASEQQVISSENTTFTLPELLITAQKRTEKLEDVPVSASVVSTETLRDNNISNAVDLNNLVPSVQLNGTINGRVPMGVRGISSVSNESAVGISSGVVIEIDSVPIPSDSFAGYLVEDVENIEVLKGPQATLGGRTASAGVINYVTRKPTDYFTGSGNITWTDDNEKRFSARVSGPMSDKVDFSLSGFDNYTPYPIRNIQLNRTTTHESYGGRGKVQWKPTEDLDATLTLHYAKAKSRGFNFVYTYLSPGAATNFPPFWTQSDVMTGINVNMDNKEYGSPVTIAGAMYGDKDIRLDMNYKLGDLTLTSTTAYQYEHQVTVQDLFAINQYCYDGFTWFLANVAHAPQFVIDAVPHFDNTQHIKENVSQISQELKAVSPADRRISFVAGVFFSRTTVDMTLYRNFFDPGGYVDLNVKPATDTYDVYGRVTSKLTDTTILVTGLRFNYDYLKYTYDQPSFGGNGPYYSEGSDGSTAIVGDISLQHKLGDGTMIYGTYARGYAPKAYNTAYMLMSNDELTPVDQEHIDHFEVGSKGVYFDYTLQMNTSVFYTDYKDYQIQTYVSVEGSVNPPLDLQSAGEASTKGVELDTIWAPTSTFTAGFSAAYIDAKFVKYTDAQCYGNTDATRPPNGVLRADGAWVQDVSGKPMPNSPKFKFVVNAEKRFTLPDTVYDLVLGGNYSYRIKTQMLSDQNPYGFQDAFGILNLHVTLDRQAGKYSLTVFGNNLFDKHYYSDLEDWWTGPWAGNVIIGQPARDASRYFGLRFGVKF